MQFKKSHTHRQTDTHTDTDTHTHRAYKWLQVPPFNLTVNVGNDNCLLGLNTLQIIYNKKINRKIVMVRINNYRTLMVVMELVCLVLKSLKII